MHNGDTTTMRSVPGAGCCCFYCISFSESPGFAGVHLSAIAVYEANEPLVSLS